VSWWAGAGVLCTGAQGFIGSWVAERLLQEGARVLVLERPAAQSARFRLRGLDERCTAVPAALEDVGSLRRALDEHGVTAVFHLAASAIVGDANSSPLQTFEVNVRGTWNLLEACRTAATTPARIVIASTDKAYGPHRDLPYTEAHALRPRYPYDASKACADILARSYAHTFGLPVAVTRLANVFGGGDFNFSRLIPGAIRALLAGEPPVIRSDGRAQRDFLYAPDAADAYLAIAASLDDPDLHGRAWNAGIGQPVSVLEVVRRLTAIAGVEVQPDIQGHGTPPGEIDRQWLDCSQIQARLGWTPAWDLQRGLADTYAWYARELPRLRTPAGASAGGG
jgi:CDP-glucose 4,6-dehydratase